MQRDDQPVIDFYHRIAARPRKRKMLVDFHGGQRPALMTRTWPNIISHRGGQGARAHEVERRLRPRARRHAAVHADVPRPDGLHAGRDAERRQTQSFKVNFKRPMSLGTRCHQLAMYVVFESPLQMLADSPDQLPAPSRRRWSFCAACPTVWDETRVLDGRIGDYIVRRAPARHGLVRRRDDRLDAARPGRRPFFPDRRTLEHGRVRRRPRRRPRRQRATSARAKRSASRRS